MQATAGTVGEALGSATDALSAIGVESPRLDAELLLAEATGVGRAALVADPGREIGAAGGPSVREMVRGGLGRGGAAGSARGGGGDCGGSRSSTSSGGAGSAASSWLSIIGS